MPKDPLQYLNKEFLTQRIEAHRMRRAELLQKAQSIQVSAAKAVAELHNDANATLGAIQQLEELLGMLAEQVGKALQSPNATEPMKKAKENAVSRQRKRVQARKVSIMAGAVSTNTSNAKPPHPDSTAAA